MDKLHIFDMDGTLLSGSACLELSRRMNTLHAVEAMEREWTLGNLDHTEYWVRLLPLWKGMTEDDIEHAFEASAWIRGIREVWEDISRRGEHSAVISLSPDFFVQRLLRWGLTTGHGAPVRPGVAPDNASTVTPESKVQITMELIGRYGLSPEDCVAYGDSSSDVPLFQTLKHTVAVNASTALREIAAVVYDGDDLQEAYTAGRALLEGN